MHFSTKIPIPSFPKAQRWNTMFPLRLSERYSIVKEPTVPLQSSPKKDLIQSP